MVINFVFFFGNDVKWKIDKKKSSHNTYTPTDTTVSYPRGSKKKTYGAMKYIIYKSVLA